HQRLIYNSLEPKNLLTTVPLPFAGSGLFQVHTNQGRVSQFSLDQNQFESAENMVGQKFEAAGFRQIDSFAYGLAASNHELVKIGANGASDTIGSVSGLPTDQGNYLAGDFASDGLFYVKNATQNDRIYGINVDTMAVENTISLSQPITNVWDFAFNKADQKFYTSRRYLENTLISIDMNGNVDVIGGTGLSRLTFGAMYSDITGSIFGTVNHTGNVYKFDLESGAATYWASGPTTGANDGFSDPSQQFEFNPIAGKDIFVRYNLDPFSGNLLGDNGLGLDVAGDGSAVVISEVNTQASNLDVPLTLPSGAALTVSPDGSFSYDPQSAFTVSDMQAGIWDSFTYEIQDSNGYKVTATVDVGFFSGAATVNLDHVQGDGGNGGEGYLVRKTDLYADHQVVVADLGDINGDGISDQIIGAPESSISSYWSGEAFVVFGQANPADPNFKTDSLRVANGGDGTKGFVLCGDNLNDLTGFAVAGGMDVNGDGINDMVITARDAENNGKFNNGRVYVFYGRSSYQAEFDLEILLMENGGDGSEGFVIHGMNSHDRFGESVELGDLNGDGLGDLIVGATDAEGSVGINNGEVLILYGSSAGFVAEIEATSLLAANGGDGTAGSIIRGAADHDFLGSDLDVGGDFNGDGVVDLVIGAPNHDNGSVDTGAVYIVYGTNQSLSAEVDLSATHAGIDVLLGGHQSELAGTSVSAAGDFNGDGYEDLLVGAVGATVEDRDFSGRAYLVYGSQSGFQSGFQFSDLTSVSADGTLGMVINGAASSDYLGNSVSDIGDFNNDGFFDIAVGARSASRFGLQWSGEAYILFGNDDQDAVFEVGDLRSEYGGDGSEGLVISGRRYSDSIGDDLMAAGDINGDGFDDMAVTGHRVNPNTDKQCYGETYFIFGFDNETEA
ncbi:MAG: hypothetical protein AAF623_11170, partial [Planctomycetota bacterium]